MLIAEEKYKTNIAEYILYMWQIEDIIRGLRFDMGEIEKNIITRFSLKKEVEERMRMWYADLVNRMVEEGITESGHLRMIQNTLNDVIEVHNDLLERDEDETYIEAFNKALPHIVRIRASAKELAKGEIETCFEALYGVLMLHLKRSPISPETQKATEDISHFLSLLTYRYHHR